MDQKTLSVELVVESEKKSVRGGAAVLAGCLVLLGYIVGHVEHTRSWWTATRGHATPFIPPHICMQGLHE